MCSKKCVMSEAPNVNQFSHIPSPVLTNNKGIYDNMGSVMRQMIHFGGGKQFLKNVFFSMFQQIQA